MSRLIQRWRSILRRLAHDEAASTYLEAVLSTAISALVLSSVVVMMYQLNVLTRKQQDTLSVSQQMESLATIMNHDVVAAREGTVSGSQMTLELVHYPFNEVSDPITTTVVYAHSDTDLTLTRSVDGDSQRVARYVQSIDFGEDGPLPATLYITVTTERREESLPTVLQFERRPAEQR